MTVSEKEYERLKELLKDEDFRTLKDRIDSGDLLNQWEYDAVVENTRDARMEWWRDARFGMIVHYGLYSILGRGEWVMYCDGMPVSEYETLADQFMPKEDVMDEWVLAAKDAGAKYLIMVTRHHDGFSLWDSKINPYNSCNYGCKRDLVREFVDACRKHDMRIGLYSTLMDWHHPDCERSAYDPEARRRFLDYTEALNVELLSNYGKIDILYYDMPSPLNGADGWESLQRNQRLRVLQPDIIINCRSGLPEDHMTPEDEMVASKCDWEACNTWNVISWGYIPEDQAINFAVSPQELIKKLCFCCRNEGNYLLNLGPRADGSIADFEKETLHKMGEWIREHEDVVYGKMRACKSPWRGSSMYGEYGAGALADVSAKENTVYLWNYIWYGNGKIYVPGYRTIPKKIYLVHNQQELDFEYDAQNYRIIIKNLPKKSPEQILGITVIAMEFDSEPVYRCGMTYPHLSKGYRERY